MARLTAVQQRQERAAKARRVRLERNPTLVHMAVRFLREKGRTVKVALRKNGIETHHEIDGTISPTSWLMDMAVADGFRPEFATSADASVRPRR